MAVSFKFIGAKLVPPSSTNLEIVFGELVYAELVCLLSVYHSFVQTAVVMTSCFKAEGLVYVRNLCRCRYSRLHLRSLTLDLANLFM